MNRIPAPERRHQIVDAAIHVIATEGLHAATTRRITEVAGMSLGTLHYVFDSKDEIFEAVLAHYTTRASTIARSMVSGIGIVAGIERDSAEAVEWLIAEPELQVAQYELLYWAFRTPGKAHLANKLNDDFIEFKSTRYQRFAAPAELDLDTLRSLARVAISLFDGLALQFLITRDVDMTRKLAASQTELLANHARSRLGL